MKHLLILITFILTFSTAAYSQLRAGGEPVLVHDNLNLALQQPIPSPDGNQLALTGANYTGVWILDLTSSELRQIDATPGTGFAMKWSPDGTSLATRTRERSANRNTFAVKLLDVVSGEATMLSEFIPHLPSTPFFDSRQQHLYVATATEVQTFNLPLQRRRSASDSAMRPVAKASFDRIVVSDSDMQLRELRPFSDAETTYLHAAISPDGSKLAFSVYGGNLHVMDLESGDMTDFGRGFFPSWSPDSRFISFTRNEDDGYRHTYGEIIAASADGTQEVVLYSSHLNIPANPYWSPTQNRVFFDYMHSGSILFIDVLTD